jgi:hypothetical protein
MDACHAAARDRRGWRGELESRSEQRDDAALQGCVRGLPGFDFEEKTGKEVREPEGAAQTNLTPMSAEAD